MLDLCAAHGDMLRREIVLASLHPVDKVFDPYVRAEHLLLEEAINAINGWSGISAVFSVIQLSECAVCRAQIIHDERGCDGPPCPGTFDVWFPDVCENLRHVYQALTS